MAERTAIVFFLTLALGCGGDAPNADSGPEGDGGGNADAGGCVESWLCTPWTSQGGDSGTRTCSDENACGTETLKPVETATLPALDFNYYQCNVEPIFDLKCSQLACHGTETGRALRIYARGRLRKLGVSYSNDFDSCAASGVFDQNCIGSIDCCGVAPHQPEEWQDNYDSARGFMLRSDGSVIPSGEEDSSELISQAIVGGQAHAGIHLFRDGDPDHVTIRDWLAGATLAQCNTEN